MEFKEVCRQIRELKIQGAESVAFAALKAFVSFASKCDASDKEGFIKSLESAKSELFATRPTEPMMRNFIRYVIGRVEESEADKVSDLKRVVRDALKTINENHESDYVKIESFGVGLISDGTNVFTHCHSSNVMDIFKKAYGVKKFLVCNTEARPLLQGRRTVVELSKAHIPVVHTLDSAASVILKNCSAMFIGADAITADGSVVNKIGSGMFARVAASMNIPVYVCAHSWKFDPETVWKAEEIEQRDPAEVWDKAPAKVTVMNPAFDIVDKRHITAIVSELGVLWPADFVRQVKKSFFLRDFGPGN